MGCNISPMGTFCTTAMAFRKGAMERASVMTGIKAAIVDDPTGMFSRVTLDGLPDEPKEWRSRVNTFLSTADMVFSRQLTTEILVGLVS